jgi:flavin reductase (DIM6/NTAB) family NADH-FMN oxidoreductase RutF
MKHDLGAKLAVYPTPVYLVTTYDKEEKPNIMTVGWGGVCNSNPPCVCISVRPATHTYHALLERKAFTMNIATEKFTREAAYCGRVSGKKENKFKKTGLTPTRSEVVDAPYIEEIPINLECKVIQIHEIGSHTQFIGQIINAKIDASLRDIGASTIGMLKPIVYGVGNDFIYYGIGANITLENN